MELLVASGIGFVTSCGIYLLLRGRTFPVVLGLTLLAYAVNVFIFVMGRLTPDAAPIVGETGSGASTDPLPQALVLTAIVIGFATTGLLLALSVRARAETGTDHVDGRERQEP